MNANFFKNKKVHLVAVGGVGMSGLAHVLLTMGAVVSGSDIQRNYQTHRLEEMGVKVYIGHHEGNVDPSLDLLVHSSAVNPNLNDEVKKAYQLGIKVLQRSFFIRDILSKKTSFAVAGVHGKTTTSGMLTNIFEASGSQPSFIIGGKLLNYNTNARWTDSEVLVVEADESDGNLPLFEADYGVITNIEWEHTDFFKSLSDIQNTFYEFSKKIKKAIIVPESEHSLLASSRSLDLYTYGISNQADFQVQYMERQTNYTRFTVTVCHSDRHVFELHVPGEHNVMNACAAIGLAYLFGVPLSDIEVGLKTFIGMGRRLEKIYESKGVCIVDDYAHHPTEVKASIKALKEKEKGCKIIGIFQPHRYSRFHAFQNQFVEAFQGLDELIVTDIYASGETSREQMSSKILCNEIKKKQESMVVEYFSSLEAIKKHILDRLNNRTTILVMGAGDISVFAHALKEYLIHEGVPN